MSSSRPAKRPRSSSDSKPGSSWPRPTSSANSVPLLLRKLEPEIVIAKCLEAMASERLLRSSDLIDIIIQDSFLEMHPLQNRNKTNIKDTKLFICKQIGPILHRIINEYLDSYVNVTTDTQSPTPSPLVPKRTPVQESSQVVNPVDTPLHAHPDLVERSPSGFARDVASLGLVVPGDIDPISAAEHIAPTDIGNWLSRDNPFPFRKNYELIQQSPVSAKPNKSPMEDLSGLSKFQWGSGDTANSKSEAGAQEENTSIANTSPLRTKHSTGRIPSVNGNAIADRQDTKSTISTSRVRTSRILRSCTFCGKELPSPSARREHESIHIANLCQWKQYQCKHCGYRSHRPREIWSHMKSRHDADKRRRGLSLEDLIDHGPLSEEKMAALRQQYQDDNSNNNNNIINLTTANFNVPAQNNPKAPDRDRQTDRDELGKVSSSAPSRKRKKID
ncbi:hypothetical protein H072_9048 [Dactylellina haptotyla CBS 200.50]|uniref:C2H2-type domain-containing protein n=1 Tax=Dactylellina haptotyla (strain CBS 200.50) TaxID=1284197 RepID=S8A3G8_DACHA|nr:hypothetical protein H072_9048 [Dactylellina haptotyla CBS 200.50]